MYTVFAYKTRLHEHALHGKINSRGDHYSTKAKKLGMYSCLMFPQDSFVEERDWISLLLLEEHLEGSKTNEDMFIPEYTGVRRC